MRTYLSVFLFGLSQFLLVQPRAFGQQKLVAAKVNFTIENAGLEVNGSFTDIRGNMNFNPENLAASSMEVSVPVATIKTGNSMRDGHLKKKEYFDAEKFPDILIKSKFFGKQEGLFRGYYSLSIKGVTKDITVPFSYVQKNNRIYLSGNFELNRRDFGVGTRSIILSDKVKVSVELEVMP